MNNILVLPMVIPLIIGILLIFIRPFIRIQRWISIIAMIATSGVSLVILSRVLNAGVLRLDFGHWLPPEGILFVADSFASLLVLTSSIVTAVCLLYATMSIEKAREQMFF